MASAASGQSWSAKRRMTRPDAGFGVNSVDLRGMRAPAAATAATAAIGVGRNNTAVPPERAASDGLVDAVRISDGVGGVMQSPHPLHQPAVQDRHVEIGQRGGFVSDPQSGRSDRQDPSRAVPRCPTVGEHGGEALGVAAIQLRPASAPRRVDGRDAGDACTGSRASPRGSPTSTRWMA